MVNSKKVAFVLPVGCVQGRPVIIMTALHILTNLIYIADGGK